MQACRQESLLEVRLTGSCDGTAEPRNPLTCEDLSEEISRLPSLITKKATSHRHTVMGYGFVIRMGWVGVCEREIDL